MTTRISGVKLITWEKQSLNPADDPLLKEKCQTDFLCFSNLLVLETHQMSSTSKPKTLTEETPGVGFCTLLPIK